jgi:hypothetical protein
LRRAHRHSHAAKAQLRKDESKPILWVWLMLQHAAALELGH